MPEPVSALAGRRADGYIRIEDTGPRGQVTLKGDLGSAEIANAVKELAGVGVPDVWQVAREGDRAAVWMAPDELLLLLPYAGAGEAVARTGEEIGRAACRERGWKYG